MMYIVRNITKKWCAGIYRKRNIRTDVTNTACGVNRYNTLWPCKDITGLTASVGAGIKETAETLRTDLLTFFVELKCWYDSGIVTFTTSGAGVWKKLVETLIKTDLQTLQQTLTEHLALIFTLLTRSKSHLFTTW